jgi:hypothetical protein
MWQKEGRIAGLKAGGWLPRNFTVCSNPDDKNWKSFTKFTTESCGAAIFVIAVAVVFHAEFMALNRRVHELQ